MTETRSTSEEAPNSSTNQNILSSSAAGHLALVPTWLPLDVAPDVSHTSAGSGGDGISIGLISATPTAIFTPSNAAIAGPHSSAEAYQTNDAMMLQHATEMAGLGGNGGFGNIALGGGDGETHAGSGGNGYFVGGMVSADVGVFAPVNTAVAVGHGSSAVADQTNNAFFMQGATQVAGMGGDGGDHNLAGFGGSVSPATSLIMNGDAYAGHGGNGYFLGSMLDVNVAIFSPINIAIGAAGGSAEAHQTNNAIFEQGGVQIAGIGGNGGGFNLSSDTIFTGSGVSGGGGHGYANGNLSDVSVAYFHPINIAVGGGADADQIDHVLTDQHTLQMAGIGGSGGEGNLTGAHSALVDDILHSLHV
ncbi:hypothetical protein [Rhizobium sp. RAF56]|uniref:hypothetical protein n=1 Tax=Rhizobium sp. RAF56 TaxID=3233062 RepID=UPI003F9687D6